MTTDVSSTAALDAALAEIDDDRLIELGAAMVDIASPTGRERPLAEHLAEQLSAIGADGQVQIVDTDADGEPTSANAHGRLGGRSAERPLLLYAPIDTVTTGDAALDEPWVGPELRPDMMAGAEVVDGVVYGLGAQNPKGHGACILMAAEALTRAGAEPPNDVLFGFGAAGMPSNRWWADRSDGHGRGCAALVSALRPADAVIAKTGWAISHEEVGLAWFTVSVGGSHTYVGSRHLPLPDQPYRNAIADAGRLVAGLEDWFETWAETHRSGLVAPQGVVSAIEGGWPNTPAFTTAVCRFHVDLRLSPRTTPDEAEAAFRAEVAGLAAAADIPADAVTVTPGVAIPGTTTDPDASVVRTAVSAWEAMEGRAHEPIGGLSGATDANILRAHGIPTARVGLPKLRPDRTDRAIDFQLGMNAVDVADMRRLTELLVRIALTHRADDRPSGGEQEASG